MAQWPLHVAFLCLTSFPTSAQTIASPAPAEQTPPDVPPKRRSHPRFTPPQIPGIYPVYEIDGKWILIDRFAEGGRRSVRNGDAFVVIGSRATDVFDAKGSSATWGASCDGRNSTRTPTLILGEKTTRKKGRAPQGKASSSNRIGTPIVGIHLKPEKKINPKAARFYRLENQVSEDVYRALGDTLKKKITEELSKGEFAIEDDDAMGRRYAQEPAPENVLLKIDFGASVKLAGKADTFFLVDGAVVSKSPRRCARLSIGNALAGRCAEMPHALMAETNILDFVAYDPNHYGHPFVLAYTTKEPLWGHERWGFRITAKGPSIFLMDALDPKCRERF